MNILEFIIDWAVKKFFPEKEIVVKPTEEEKSTQKKAEDLRIKSESDLRRDLKYYEDHVKNINSLIRSRDYVRVGEQARLLGQRYWREMTPEKYASLTYVPSIRECGHRKGGAFIRNKPKFARRDFNIMDHTFPTGVRVVKCLNNCGWKSSPGDENWLLAQEMLKETSNKASSSEIMYIGKVPIVQLPTFDPRLTEEENMEKAGYEEVKRDEFGVRQWAKKKTEEETPS